MGGASFRSAIAPDLCLIAIKGKRKSITRIGERLAEAGIEPSVGSKGTATPTPWPRRSTGELIRRRAPWKIKEAVELATLEWVAWFITAACSHPLAISRPQKLKQTTTDTSPVKPPTCRAGRSGVSR